MNPRIALQKFHRVVWLETGDTFGPNDRTAQLGNRLVIVLERIDHRVQGVTRVCQIIHK